MWLRDNAALGGNIRKNKTKSDNSNSNTMKGNKSKGEVNVKGKKRTQTKQIPLDRLPQRVQSWGICFVYVFFFAFPFPFDLFPLDLFPFTVLLVLLSDFVLFFLIFPPSAALSRSHICIY